jgi:predicted transcriptional regulator
MIEDIFRDLNFKEEEVKVYLSLLDKGASNAGDLAKQMGMKRPSVYVYLENLVQGGLVTQSIRNGVKIFLPESGERIRDLYKRKIDHLQRKQESLDEIIPILEKRAGSSFMRPRIQFFEGRSGMEAALQDILSFSGIASRTFWSARAAIEATSSDFFWWHNKERIRKNIHLKAAWPSNQVVDVKCYPFIGAGGAFLREIRIAPPGIESSLGYWIYGNRVLFASSQAESYSFIIESAELVQMMTMQHQVIWDISSPLQVKDGDVKPFLDDLYRN